MCVAQTRVYVTDQGNDRVCAFSADKLSFLYSFGATGSKPGELREPRGLAEHGGELFVADSRNHRIVVYGLDAEGEADGTTGEEIDESTAKDAAEDKDPADKAEPNGEAQDVAASA